MFAPWHQHTPPCNASLKHPGWMHETMKDTLKLSCFSLHGSDMFITPSGNTLKSLSTVRTHARVTHTHHISTYIFPGAANHRTLAALTINHLRRLSTLTMNVALPSFDNLLGAPLVVTTSCLCTMRDTNTLLSGLAHASLHTACPLLCTVPRT